MKKIVFNCLIFLLITASLQAATTDTVTTYSAVMKKNIKAVVITPQGYNKNKTYPVVYLLHGAGGNYSDWTKKVPAVKEYADAYNILIVCPDGNVTSWYFDSPVDSTWKYETYVSKELVSWIDEHYATLKQRTGRAITGLSMGGHGALYLAFKHQDIYGAAGSMSGGVDITPFPANWDIAKRLGSYADNAETWQKNTVINLTYLLNNNNLKLIIDCGSDDFFYKVNIALHEKLLYSNIPHDFISRQGGHSWDYWANAVGYQMLFMHNFFVQEKK